MNFTATEREMIGVERIQHYLDNDVESLDKVEHSSGDEFSTGDGLTLLNIPHNKTSEIIEFKNVSLRYENEFNRDSKLALDDVTFSVKKNQKIAFVGRTGSGKTSILNALFGLYAPQKGDIKVDGMSIKTLSLRALRQKIVR